MISTNNTFSAAKDQKTVFYRTWLPENKDDIRAVVQLAHGLAEHGARYERFAKALTHQGYAVYINDHRGHGETAGELSQVGYYEDGNFWKDALADMRQLNEVIQATHPNQSIFLFGHSMGSLLFRHYLALYGNDPSLKGAILSGTGGDPGVLGVVGTWIAKIACFFKGRKTVVQLLDMLSFGKFNDAFKPNRTKYDWLSRVNGEVDKYVADPYCGVIFTAGFFVDLLEGIKIINSTSTYKNTPNTLPIFLFAGDKDPVGDNGKGVKQVYEAYQKAGIKNVSCTLYPDGRHEMLNETNKEEVTKAVINWIEAQIR
ncbi:MAG: lysophospholipase [Chitinophagales bacterium]